MSSKSDTWKHFVKKGSSGICKHCHIEVKTCGNTTNLRNHLLRRHPTIKTINNIDAPSTSKEKPVTLCYENESSLISSKDCDSDLESVASSSVSQEKSNFNQLTMDLCVNNIKSFKVNGNKNGQINNAIMFMICKDSLPLNTVEKEGFQYLMKTTVPLYKLPSRRTVTQMIDDKYDIVSLQFKEKLVDVESICLTTDIWTDPHNTRSYMGLTGHFIDEGDLMSINFGVSHLTEPHNADYLTQMITTMAEKWGITSEKVTAVITDNGANIVKAVITAYGKSKHIWCFAHTLNLVAQKPFEEKDGVESAKALLHIIKDITRYFKQNVNAADALRKAQNNTGLPLKLIQSVCTRWNSIYYQIERFVKLSEFIAPILLNHPKAPSMLSASQLDAIKDLINILKPMEAVTKEVCAEKFVTSSKIIPIVSCLFETYSAMKTETEVGTATKKLIIEGFKKRFGTVEQVNMLAISTILDPRFKKIHFSDKLACSKAIDKINTMIRIFKNQLEKDVTHENSAHIQPQITEAEEPNIWEFHNKLVKNQRHSISQEIQGEGLQDEFKHYLAQPVVDLNTTNPISYWHNHKHSFYSSIRPIANRYFCVVGTSVPCERLFSVAGNIASDERSRLDPERLDKLIFLKSLDFNYWEM
ncbi:zinc finger BED domain-containing protein 4-like isoform X2 [Sitophilus oryzae]|uniref:Zinc finger BED domain-containing protein 4-like isoform X2 n=1 Tax=Sitophilus oryzae TaxID=7048 RepID=A0A6J2Y3D3_SITOR|nr:zinc finger BED domain-containing protein 4-like isoform X2 [Sitophilus oryzae]XP_030757771.1 zinc finger BED domain-containing protein 4-like isoform X2 [Sitophilus oryzae]XP_030763540.1 zinc finger BED domain-containing protein 4-like isoform X2 [Sitophilus oryzae]